MTSYNHIFQKSPKPAAVAPSIVTDLNKFTSKLTGMDRVKQKKEEDQLKNGKRSKNVCLVAYDDIQLASDIETQFKKSGWATMDMCMKWKCIQDYMDRLEMNSTTHASKLRELLKEGRLVNVVYDKKSSEIKKLNIKINNIEI